MSRFVGTFQSPSIGVKESRCWRRMCGVACSPLIKPQRMTLRSGSIILWDKELSPSITFCSVEYRKHSFCEAPPFSPEIKQSIEIEPSSAQILQFTYPRPPLPSPQPPLSSPPYRLMVRNKTARGLREIRVHNLLQI